MRGGKLDRRITIQRKTVTESPSGEPVETWSIVGEMRRSASRGAVRGDERFNDPQLVAREQVEFRVRYSADVAALSPQDRIVEPALEEASPQNEPRTRDIYDVLGVHEIGRREGLRILTARRADVTA